MWGWGDRDVLRAQCGVAAQRGVLLKPPCTNCKRDPESTWLFKKTISSFKVHQLVFQPPTPAPGWAGSSSW